MRKKTIEEYVKEDLEDFSEACYDMNTIKDLQEAYQETTADRNDMEAWGISAAEWHYSIKVALAHKLAELGEA